VTTEDNDKGSKRPDESHEVRVDHAAIDRRIELDPIRKGLDVNNT
jgi:hypothetical protein